MSLQKIIEIATPGRGAQEITAAVAAVVGTAGIATGVAHVFVRHTSCSLTITENADPEVRRDLETIFARLAPDGDPEYHHRLEGRDDMAAHARSVVCGSDVSVPVGGGQLLLGSWQGIYLWEHRTRGSVRSVVVTVLGG